MLVCICTTEVCNLLRSTRAHATMEKDMERRGVCMLCRECCTRPDRSKFARSHAPMEKDVERGMVFARAEMLYQARPVKIHTLSRTYGERYDFRGVVFACCAEVLYHPRLVTIHTLSRAEGERCGKRYGICTCRDAVPGQTGQNSHALTHLWRKIWKEACCLHVQRCCTA